MALYVHSQFETDLKFILCLTECAHKVNSYWSNFSNASLSKYQVEQYTATTTAATTTATTTVTTKTTTKTTKQTQQQKISLLTVV